MERMDYSSPEWWKHLPCHLCPEWNLKGELNLDVRKLKLKVDWSLEDEPDFMPIENLLYRAFLEVAPDSYMMKGRSSPETALKFLEKAEDQVERIWIDNEGVQNSYKLVINAFRMWLYNDGQFKESSKIDELNDTLKCLSEAVGTTSTPHIDVVLATALKRLGRYRYDDAIALLDKAMDETDDARSKHHWLFCKALLIGRNARSEQKSARGKMSGHETENLYSEERTILKQVVDAAPTFATAKAHLGECLYHSKRTKHIGIEHLFEAYKQSPENRAIAIIYGRVLRWQRRFKKSEETFRSIRNWKESVEVSFQLGKIYQQRGKDNSLADYTRRANLERAFELVNSAVELDQNHIPALCTKAELVVSLRTIDEAKSLVLDILQGRNMDPEQLYFFQCHVNGNPHFFKIFSPSKRLEIAYQILFLCTENYIEASNSGRKEFTGSHELGTGEAFKVLHEAIFSQSEFKLDAMRWLSDIHFRLGNFRESSFLLTVLQEGEERPKYKSEILLQQGKCLCELGDDVAAERAAEILQGIPGDTTQHAQCRELFASIHLMRAKATLKEQRLPISENQRSIASVNFRIAINYGSIEACYVFLNGLKDLPQKVWSENNEIASILADIKRCLARKDNHHHIFPREGHSNEGMPVTSAIEELMSDILTFPRSLQELPHLLKTRYELITSIRRNLIEFEYSFKYTCGGEWDKICGEVEEKTLTDARNLLDHVIYSYQRAVYDKQPTDTKFPIHCEDNKPKPKKDELDGRNTVEYKFDEYLKKYFPKANPPVPEKIRRYFLQIQPMSNPDNNWLLALSHYVNNIKHKGAVCGNTVECKDKRDKLIKYKKEDLVRISCSRVEAIASTLLEYVQDLYDDGETRPGFLLEREQSALIVHDLIDGIIDLAHTRVCDQSRAVSLVKV